MAAANAFLSRWNRREIPLAGSVAAWPLANRFSLVIQVLRNLNVRRFEVLLQTFGCSTLSEGQIGDGPMSLSVDFSAWHVQRRGNGETTTDILGGERTGVEISRIIDYSDGQTKQKTATIRLDCRVEQGLGGFSINSFFSLYFKPFRVPHEMTFVMGLLSPDYGGGFCVVTACPVKDDPDTSLLFVSGSEDVDKCLSALSSGEHLNFTLMQIETKENLVDLPLPNDGEFKKIYRDVCDRLMRGDTFAPQTSTNVEDEVQKNPRGFNIWMVEPTPGEYTVLLVKLDSSGGMADAWQLGKAFSNRKEQGAYALDTARNFRIKLMDVVKD